MGHSNEKCSLPGKAACTAQWHRLPGLAVWTPSVIPMMSGEMGLPAKRRAFCWEGRAGGVGGWCHPAGCCGKPGGVAAGSSSARAGCTPEGLGPGMAQPEGWRPWAFLP